MRRFGSRRIYPCIGAGAALAAAPFLVQGMPPIVAAACFDLGTVLLAVCAVLLIMEVSIRA